MCEHSYTGRQCNTCASRTKRANNPVRYAYDTLKANVIRRKGRNFWALSFEEFKELAIEFDYVGKKGVTSKSYTVDTKDPTMGYFIGNIRVIENGANSKKKRKFLNYEWSEHDGRMIAFLTDNEPVPQQNSTDDPF